MIKERHWWVLFFLLFAVGLSTWLTFSVGNQKKQNTPEEDALDSFATQVHVTTLDKMGRISTQLYTSELKHYTKHNNTQLQSPELILYVKNQPAWHITANTGEIANGSEKILLKNQVKLHQARGSSNEEVTVLTDELVVYPEKKIASTDQPITLTSDTTKISSLGMNGNLTEGALELKANARGEYEIPAH